MTKASLTTSQMVAIKTIDLVHHLKICFGVVIFFCLSQNLFCLWKSPNTSLSGVTFLVLWFSNILFVSIFVFLCVLVRVCLFSGYHSQKCLGIFWFSIFLFVSKCVCPCVLVPVPVCLLSGYHSPFENHSTAPYQEWLFFWCCDFPIFCLSHNLFVLVSLFVFVC